MRKTLILLLLFISGYVYAQEPQVGYIIQPPGDIGTDRPDQTESTDILQPGYVQIESGGMYEKYTSDDLIITKLEQSVTTVSGLIRIGVFPSMELRIAPEYSIYKNKITFLDPIEYPFEPVENKVDGFTPLTIGTKIKIINETETSPALSFLFHVDLTDIASKNFKGGYSSPEVRFAGSKQLDERFSLGVNGGAIFDIGSRRTVGLYTISLGADIINNYGGFLEFYGFIEGESYHYLDGGLTYKFKRNIQADVSAGIGLSEYTSDFFVSGGLSVRLPR